MNDNTHLLLDGRVSKITINERSARVHHLGLLFLGKTSRVGTHLEAFLITSNSLESEMYTIV